MSAKIPPPAAYSPLLAALADSLLRQQTGDRDGAVAVLLAALEAASAVPGDPAETAQVWWQLGLLLRGHGRPEDVETCFDNAVRLLPDDPLMRCARGEARHALDRYDEAEADFRAALRWSPAQASLHFNLGVALRQQRRVDEAADAFAEALRRDPALAPAAVELANCRLAQARLDDAVLYYRRALELDPRNGPAGNNLLFAANYLPDISPEELFATYRRWAAAHEPAPPPPPPPNWDGRRPLRVGYVSPDFCQHPVLLFIVPILLGHRPARVEVHCYADVARPDRETARLRELLPRWRDIAGLDDEAAAAAIRADGIDVLVDLAGHTARNRLGVFARRPAPVQVTYLGFGYSTGLSAVDWFLATPAFVPPEADRYFSEGVWRLPRSLFCYQMPANPPAEGPLPARRDGHVTFGSLTRLLRVNHRVVAAWAAILRRLPQARLLLNTPALADLATRERIEVAFAAAGIAKTRLTLIATRTPMETWASYQRIDVALDPFPHNAGTTTFEALCMGVPVLSLADRPPLGRFGAELLPRVGLDDWVCPDVDTYVARAVDVAADLDGLARLRRTLRERLRGSVLCDAGALVDDLEAAYTQMMCRAVGTAS